MAWRGCPAPSRSRFRSDRKKSENFSKSRGRPSSRCRSVSGRPIALLRVDVNFFPIAPRKILLHALAGSHLTTIRRGNVRARGSAAHLWYVAVGGSDDNCGRHRAGDPAGRPKHTRCAGSGTTQSSAAPCVLRGERKLKQSRIGAVVTTVGGAGRATRQSPLWAHLGTISHASSRTSVRSEAKNHLKFFFSKIFLSPVRSCGRTSGFHVLPFVLPSDRRKNGVVSTGDRRMAVRPCGSVNTEKGASRIKKTMFPCCLHRKYTISPANFFGVLNGVY